MTALSDAYGINPFDQFIKANKHLVQALIKFWAAMNSWNDGHWSKRMAKI